MQVTSGSASLTTADDRPAELSQLMQTLRQLRPPSTVETECNGTREDSETATGTDSREADVAVNGVEGKEAEEEAGLAAMEARLKLYIDERFEQLERRLEKKLEEMFSSQLQHCAVINSRLVQDEDLD